MTDPRDCRRRDRRRARLRGRACTLLAVLLCARPTGAAEFDEVFPATGATDPLASAESILAAAFSNLFEFDGGTRIESTQTTRDGETRQSSFRIYRKTVSPSELRVLIATDDPEAPDQEMRMLEVIEDRRRQRARLFAPRVDAVPVATTYRLTDPFLGTFSNKPPEEVRSDLSALARAYEIIGRGPGTLDGAEVDRITVRPLGTRSLERIELRVALDAPLILEYRYFEVGSPEAARVARVPRDQMRPFQDRLLPGVVIYEDRLDQSTTRVVLRYEALPGGLGDAPFMESTFHRAALPD